MHMEIDSDAEMLPNFWDDGPSLTPRVSGDLFVWRLSQNSVLTQKLSKHSKQSCQTVGFGGQWGLSHNQLFLFSCTFPLDNFCTLFHTKVISYQPLALHLNQILLKLIYQNSRNSIFFWWRLKIRHNSCRLKSCSAAGMPSPRNLYHRMYENMFDPKKCHVIMISTTPWIL